MVLYIDPGTGSMLFTILIGAIGTLIYFFRGALVKLRFLFSGGVKHGEKSDSIPYAIFTDSKRYWNLFEPICDEFEKREQPLVYLTASPDDPALKKEYQFVERKFIGEGNRAFARLNFLSADILLSTTPGVDVFQWKRSKNVKWYVHIPHAVDDITSYKMFGTDYYDAVLVSGGFQEEEIRALEKLRALPEKEVRLIGMPYMDRMLERSRTVSVAHDEFTVLLAPSWGVSGILSRYGEEVIEALLDTGYHLVIRPHPQSFTSEAEMLQNLMKKYPNSAQLEWNTDNDNFDILSRSDILISDFSGVIFDYALIFGRPIIYADTSFDKSTYDACWLEDEMWKFKILDRIGRKLDPKEFADLKNIIADMVANPEYSNAIESARQEAWANIGRGAELTADYMIQKRSELLSSAENSHA